MTKKHYMAIGSAALAVTLLGTSALILAAKNVFDGAVNEETNPYNSVPVGKMFTQAMGFDGKDFGRCQTNQVVLAKASQLLQRGETAAQDKQYQEAIDAYAESLECMKQYPGLDCVQAISVLTDKARCEEQLGLTKEREQTLRTLVDVSARTYNKNHQQVASALESLGELLFNQNRPGEALPLVEQALEIRKKGAGLESGDTAFTLSQLGHCYLELKNYKRADELYSQAIVVYEKLDGDGFSESQQIARENLANSYCWQDRYKEAIDIELAVLADLEKKKLSNSTYAANAFVSAGVSAQRQDDQVKMHEYLGRAEKIAEGLVHTEDNVKRAEIYSDIADAYNDDDDFKNELHARKQSIEAYRGLKDPEEENKEKLAQSLVKGGSCALKLKDFSLAQTYFGEALSQARDNRDIRLKLKANKDQIQEYLKYIEKDGHAVQDASIKMQTSELKEMFFS